MRRWWWGHLKAKVLAFGFVMSVLPLALYALFGLGTARSAQVEIAQAENQATASRVAGQLSQFAGRLTQQLQLVARLEGADLLAAPPDEQERVLLTLLRDLPYLEEVALADSQGQELSRASRREVVTGVRLPTHRGTPLWTAVAESGAALGEVTLDVDGRPLIPLAVVLPDGAGALVGRATLRGALETLTAAGDTGQVRILVADRAGRLVGATDFSLVLAGSRLPALPEGDFAYRSVTGEQALGAREAVAGLDWQVVGETPVAAAMEPVRRLGVTFGLAGAALMVVLMLLSVIFGLQLTEPLERLEAGARRVGQGDLSHRVPEGGRDELGRLIHAFNQMTERLGQQDMALRAERDRLDTVVSAIGAGLALIDPRGQVLWTNRTLREWFPGPLEGRPCREALQRPDCGPDCPVRSGVERQVTVGGRTRLIRHSAYLLSGGKLEVMEDVTERRAMEAMVRQSEKLAAVGQLAAGVAHEINNPLAVISAYAEDLQDRLREEGAPALDASGELQSYLGQLQVQVQRCKGITTNLLGFARQGSAETEPVDLADVARRTAALVLPRARKQGVTVQVAAAEGLPQVRATRDQVQQVFLNLITNSLDALEERGAGSVTATVTEGGFTVSDDGPGMDAATLERAMEPFYTTKPVGRGTGLGLSTCYGIITGLGGTMSLES